MLTDLRPALRTMVRRPWSATAIAGTLALGVGATTLVFTFVNGVLLRPLPFPEPERLVAIWSRYEKASGYTRDFYPVGSPEYFDYERQNRTMESVAGIGSTTVTITAGSGDPELLNGATVTSSFFSTLRASAAIGRTLQPEDDPPDAAWAVVLSHGVWARRFGADPAVVGRAIDLELGDQPGTVAAQVVGVMPAGFQFPRADTAMWLPLHLDPARTWRGGHWFSMIARLKPGVTVAGAAAEMATLMSRWAVEYPDHHTGHGLFLLPLLDDLVATAAPRLRLLTAVVGCVLLIATANVAGLLLAAGEVRRREFALRAALGGGRRRLFGQLLVESLALCLAGGALGVALAAATLRSAVAITAERMPRLEMVRLDMTAAGFTVAVSVTVALLLAALQARRVGSGDLAGLLRSGGRGVAGSSVRLRRGLVVLEVALGPHAARPGSRGAD